MNDRLPSMQHQPLVSICCITFNHEKFIKKCIDGFLLQQTDFPIEIIIHDDASLDRTPQIIQEYTERYPNLIIPIFEPENQYSKGKKALIDLTLPRATGKYIALCEGDDYWTDPHKLQKQVDFLEAHPDYISCYHDAMIVDENGSIVKPSKLPDNFKKDFSSEEISKGAWILTLTHCFRNMLKDIPAEVAHVYNGDTFLNSLLGNFGKGKYMNDIAPAVYRLHPESIWSRLDESDKMYHGGVTHAWMYRYYKRIGQLQYAQHYKNLAIKDFHRVLEILASGNRAQHEDIVNNISNQYTDIIEGTSGKNLRNLLQRTQRLIDIENKGNHSMSSFYHEPSGQEQQISIDNPSNNNQKINRVLFVNHNLYPFEVSGTPLTTLNHAVGMVQRGLEVAVLIPSPKIKKDFTKECPHNFTLYQIPALDKSEAYFATAGDDRLSRYREMIENIIDDFSPQIVHINDYVYMPAEIIEIFSRRGCLVVRSVCNCEEFCHRDQPVISSELNGLLCPGPESSHRCTKCFLTHSATATNSQESSRSIENNIEQKFSYIKKLYRDVVDKVIFTSEPFKKYFKQFAPIAENKLRVIPRGFEFDYERQVKDKRKTDEIIHFAYISHIMFSKGIDVALKAFEKICRNNNFVLHLYGELVNPEYQQWIDELQRRYPDNFINHGRFNKDSLPTIASNIDICLIPSYFDTYNRVLREILYLGIPVIVTDFFGAYIVEDGKNGFKIPIGDHEALAQKMVDIINNPSMIKKLSRGAANTQIPNLDDEIDQILETYNDLYHQSSEKKKARLDAMAKDNKKIRSSSENAIAKLIAFYLPQYYPIPENDQRRGKGFTEWTDVVNAQPLFPGHYQPHLPIDLGFYDLRLPEARKAQADLAREYGIHGFCYHHYWFNGKLLLERPLQEILESGEPDFPFCICWNNGDWPRASDRADEILIEQIYSEEDDRNHIRYLCKFFQDKRYIRVDGKPLLLVNGANHLPDPLKTASIWREEARVLGIGELYLCRVESSSEKYGDPKAIGFDASVELQPDKANLGQRLEDPLYEGNPVYRYKDFVRNAINKKDPPYLRFPCVTPSWDNSPKRGKDSAILTDSSPQLYEEWLRSVIKSIGGKEENERLVFINAWNEWGEGNHLEPDLKHGRGYLKATSSALYDLEEFVTEDTIQTKYKAIESMIESGKEDQAMAALEELISIDPDHALAHNDLGVLFFHKGNAEEALRHLERAARIKPDHLDILKNLADIYLQADRSEDAVATYEKVLSIIPEDVETLLVMGALMYQLNRSGKAAYFFRKVLDVDSDNVQAKEHLLLLEGEKDHAQHIAAEGKVLKVGLLLATKDNPEYNGFVATGLGYVAANLRKSLPQVTVFFKERVEDMLREEPDLIGISSVTEDYYIAIQMAETIKKHRDLPVVLGGIHISLIPESLKPCFDIGVIGEGEITFVEVVNTLLQEHDLKPEALKDIPGIVFWDQGKLVKTPPREILNDLDSLPEPILEELPYYRSSTVACLVSARGCPYHCTFCASEKFARTYRSFSTKRILDTIEDLVWNKNISHIVFYDDLLIANKKKISELVAGLEQRGLLGKCSFSCQVRANVVDDEICSLLKKMNVVDTGMGVESFSDKILRYYNKSGVTAEVNQRALDILHRHGIKANPSIIFAAPPETREDMLITFRKVYENIRDGKINTVAWGILRPYPGTKIWEYAEARGIVGKDMDWNRFSNWSTFDNYLCETVQPKEFYKMMDEWLVKNSLVRKPGSGYSNFWINDPVELYCKVDDLKESIRTRTEPELGDDLVLARETTIDNPLFAEGWYEPEKDKGRWMKQSARLIFKNDQQKRFAFLFYVQPEVFKRVYKDSLELKVFDGNERLMFQKQYTADNFGTGLHSIQLPIPRNQDVCLDIRFDKSMIPAEHGLSRDDRRVSVLVKRVFTLGKVT